MPHTDSITPPEIQAITKGLVRLGRQIDLAATPEDVATALAPILNRHDGALLRIAQIFEAIGRICNDFIEQDPYACDLQEIADESFNTITNLSQQLVGFDEQFRTFAPHITRTPNNQRPVEPSIAEPSL
ncbi:hypothetical protein [Streptomyces sp. NPDC088141]|uniref:hypothetical protein n=1 Tax=Streptomyces sp. NPDC088141 TaxID=3155179 RepID=UPI0034206778